ncbi:preprotein translocase subunit SecG [bacterium]|nr:preprotein translocase subunit SecG [bacterium]MBU1614924.1 preprotein translocase subunit SecG [bacterium]
MSLIIAVHIFASVFLICLVLLQSGKGSDLGAALGGGSSSQSVFGTRRGNVLTKATTILATIFMVTSLTITVLKSHPTSIIKGGGEGISEQADTQAEVLQEKETSLPMEVKEEVEKPEGEPVSEKAEPIQVKPVMIEPAKKEEPKKEAPRTKEEVPVKKEETKKLPSAGQGSPAPTVEPQATTPKEEAQTPGETSKEPPLEESPKQEPPLNKD